MMGISSATVPRIARTAFVTFSALASGSTLASAHDFWLVPTGFRLAAETTIEIRGQTSSRFPTSEAAVATDRVAEARVIAAASATGIADLSVRGTSLVLRHRASAPGQRVVAVTLHPRSLRQSAAGFRRYLELEGAPEVLARVDREGLLSGRDSVTRRYAKYAKTIVEVGSGGSRAFAQAAGHPLEFVPEVDPYTLRAGGQVSVRLLYRGQPLPGVQVHAGWVPTPEDRVPLTSASPASDVHLTSDAEGRVRLPLSAPGMWNVRTLHVVQSDPGSGADWDTHWATLVFHVAGAREAASDSAAVVTAVDAYHRALSAGDSAAALALLTEDAVILESGGVETRAEYRSHHLPADIGFAQAVPSVRGPVRVVVNGDVAWASSTSTTQGEFRGRPINSTGAELMVLVRTPDGWKIAAIHWSSRTRRQ